MILDAWGWCTGTTQRDGMGREEGEGSGCGTHVYLWQIYIAKAIQYCKVKKIKRKSN